MPRSPFFACATRLLPLSLLLLALPAFAGWGSPQTVRPRTAPAIPLEEGNIDQARRAWYESLHRAAPGTDWRQIEKANAMAGFLERQAILTGAAPEGGPPGSWTELGSANQTGRNHVTALSPDGLSLYIGTAHGGLWKGTASGTNFAPVSDNVGLGVHHLTICPGPPEVILTGTLDGSLRYTNNGGATWFVPGGLPDAVWQLVRLRRDLGSARRVFALLEAWRWTGTEFDHSYQLYRSDDGGANFLYLRSEPLNSKPDIWTDRLNPGPLYLLVADTLKRSTTLGVSFTDVGLLPESGDDAVLVGCEAGAPKLYAQVHVGGEWHLYSSPNAGATWTLQSVFTNSWRSLCASTSNLSLLLRGDVNCYRSVNGGAVFTAINDWTDYYADPQHKLHADIDGIDCIRKGAAESFYINSDGGTCVSTDGGATVNNITRIGFRNAQFYSTLTSIHNPYLVAGGTQDQGYQISHPDQGVPFLNFEQTISGDYGHLSSTNHDHNMLYCVYPTFVLVQLSEGYAPPLDLVSFPAGEKFDFLPNLQADPDSQGICYVCGQKLWVLRSLGGGTYSWTPSTQDFGQGNPDDWVTAVAIAPSDHSHWYAATKTGALWYSLDHGDSWSLSPSTGPQAHYFYGTSLLVSPTDPNVGYVAGAGYGGPAVYQTGDGGITWNAMGSGLPSTLILTLAFDNPTHQEIYAAGEAGPYRFDTGTAQWVSVLGTQAPLTTYWSVEGVPALGTVRFGTSGRGIWDYNTAAVVSGVGPGKPRAGPSLSITPNPSRNRSTLAWSLSRAGNVRLEVFDVAGRRLATLVDGPRAAGHHQADLNLRTALGRPVGDGIYLVRLVTQDGVTVGKLALVR